MASSQQLILHPLRALDAESISLLTFIAPFVPTTSPAFVQLLFSSPGTVAAVFAHHLMLNRAALVPGGLSDDEALWYVVNDFDRAGLAASAGLVGHGFVDVEVGFHALPLTAELLPKLYDFGVVIPSRHGWLGPEALREHLADNNNDNNNDNHHHHPCAPDATAYANRIRYMLAHLVEGYAAECDWAGKTRMAVAVAIKDGDGVPDKRLRKAVRGVMEGRGFRRDGKQKGVVWVTRSEMEVLPTPAHRHRSHRSMSDIPSPMSPASSFELDVGSHSN